jgi:L-amino acid N-acyltransferase YncA
LRRKIELGFLFLSYSFQRVIEQDVRTGAGHKKLGTLDPILWKTILSPSRLGSSVAAANPANGLSKCLVRPSTKADMPHVTAIYSHFVATSTATFESVAPDESEMGRRRQAVLDLDLPYLVAELEGYVVGFCYASQFRPRDGYRFTVEDSIYVRPDCIGHRVGSTLLAQLVLDCKLEGCHSMVACICGVNVASVALHTALGFQQVGLLPEAGRKFGQWLPLSIMQRQLR